MLKEPGVFATDTTDDADAAAAAARPVNLSVATTDWLASIEALMRNAAPLKPVADLAPAAPVTIVAGGTAPPPSPANP